MKELKPLWKVGTKDWIKGGIIAALTVVVAGATTILSGLTQIPPVYPTLITFENLALTGLTAGGIYLLKNLLTNSNDEFAKPEQK